MLKNSVIVVRGSLRRHHSFGLSILEDYCLLVFEVNVERLHSWMTTMQREVDNAPSSFHGTDIPAVDVVL